MGALQANHFVTTNYIIAFLILIVNESKSLNLGLIAGDFKKPSSPLIIKKYSRHSPVFININNSKAKPLTTPSIPKLPPKLPSMKLLQPSKLGSKLSSPKLPRSIITPIIVPPLIPKLPRSIIIPRIIPPLIPKLPPLPPLLPPLLPLILPPLPILPFPLIPRLSLLPKLSSPLKPLRVPILKKLLLQKALGSEHKPIIVPFPDAAGKNNMLEKLMELKKRGSLTTAEYIRFKKLLLK